MRRGSAGPQRRSFVVRKLLDFAFVFLLLLLFVRLNLLPASSPLAAPLNAALFAGLVTLLSAGMELVYRRLRRRP